MPKLKHIVSTAILLLLVCSIAEAQFINPISFDLQLWKAFKVMNYDCVLSRWYSIDSAGREHLTDSSLYTCLKHNPRRYRHMKGNYVTRAGHDYFFGPYGVFAVQDSFTGDHFENPAAWKHFKLNAQPQAIYCISYESKPDSLMSSVADSQTLHWNTAGKLDTVEVFIVYSKRNGRDSISRKVYWSSKRVYSYGLNTDTFSLFEGKPGPECIDINTYGADGLPLTQLIYDGAGIFGTPAYYKEYYSYEKRSNRKKRGKLASE